MSKERGLGRRALQRLRRRRGDGPLSRALVRVRGEDQVHRADVGWDRDADDEASEEERSHAPITAQVMALFGEPSVVAVSVDSVARALRVPRLDAQNAIDALVSAGELRAVEGHVGRFAASPERKAELETLFRDAAHELGETQALVHRDASELARFEDEEEPRLPVTAGLLSVFLPGTGQLLNGDVGRASLVFAVWSLALLTNLSPIWTFVCLYAGAEAFFTAKVRGMERKLALEAAQQKAKVGAG